MEPIDLARATTPAIRDFTAAFMFDPATYRRGAELGHEALDFYFVGRGGVLGETTGAVVAAAFVFFAPDLVVEAWDRGAAVGPRHMSAVAFAEQGHRWAREHIDDSGAVEAAGVVARLGGKVVDAANPAGAPLFAGWRALEAPADVVAAAHHTLNALRELRAALHAGAVLATGLEPGESVLLADPNLAAIHGFDGEPAPAEARRGLLDDAEAGTDRAMAGPLGVLTGGEPDEFAAACAVLHARL